MTPSKSLADALSVTLLNHPYDPQSTLPEKFRIDFLVEELEAWELGENSTDNLMATFAQHDVGDFDIRSFIQTHVDEGTYEWPDDPPTE